MAELSTESPNSQMQQPYMQNQQVLITHIQGVLTENPMNTNSIADQS